MIGKAGTIPYYGKGMVWWYHHTKKNIQKNNKVCDVSVSIKIRDDSLLSVTTQGHAVPLFGPSVWVIEKVAATSKKAIPLLLHRALGSLSLSLYYHHQRLVIVGVLLNGCLRITVSGVLCPLLPSWTFFRR